MKKALLVNYANKILATTFSSCRLVTSPSSTLFYCKLYWGELFTFLPQLSSECNTYLRAKSACKTKSCWVLEGSGSGLRLSQLTGHYLIGIVLKGNWRKTVFLILAYKSQSELHCHKPREKSTYLKEWFHVQRRTDAALYVKEPIFV